MTSAKNNLSIIALVVSGVLLAYWSVMTGRRRQLDRRHTVVLEELSRLLAGDVFAPLLLRGNFITVSSVMMTRGVFADLGGFVHQPGGCEDWDCWLRGSQRYEFSVCAEPLVGYRFTSNSMSRNYRAMAPARRRMVWQALASKKGRRLGWRLRRQIWAETCRTNGWDAGQAGARLAALRSYAQAVAVWPLTLQPFKEALRVCIYA